MDFFKFNHIRAQRIDSLFTWLELSSPMRLMIFVICALLASTITWLVPADEMLSEAARRALFILLFASGLWLTEAIPAYAVGLLIIGLQILLLGKPGGIYAESDKDWEEFVVVLGHPLIWLFFGGFVLAAGMAKTGLDKKLAVLVIYRVGSSPINILLGIMAVTFILSMFMSNTATTAMMLAMLAPMLRNAPEGSITATCLALGVAAAANLGGMASLIGTPANAIAVGALSEVPNLPNISFLQWIRIGLPPGLFLLSIAALLLGRQILKDDQSSQFVSMNQSEAGTRGPRWQVLVMTITLLTTIGLWLTSGWHGAPPAAVSFLPIVILTASGILGPRDIRGLNYDVLFLIAGGLALGQLVVSTGLSEWLVGHLPVDDVGKIGVILMISYTTVALSNLMSNTAAANILIPLGITLGSGFEAQIAVPIALSASVAMILPISTPPNAIVYASGYCKSSDFLKLGVVLGIIAPLVVTIWTQFVL
jgi:sodium-dependent dicarboxylate transporter 2/3/5